MNNLPDQNTIQAMVEALSACFKQVRPLILENAGKSQFSDKKDGSPVTDIDVEVENIIISTMARQFPDIPIFGEEAGYEDSLPEVAWLIDPIDNTDSFVKGTSFFTCMGVLVIGGEPIACVIYNPSNKDLFTAQKGKGAYKNGSRLDLANTPLAATAYCKKQDIETLNEILRPESVTCKSEPNGAGYGFISVAEGSSAARIQLNGHGYPHDYAPGALLVSEAGGAIITLLEVQKPYMLKTFIACHPRLANIFEQHKDTIRDRQA